MATRVDLPTAPTTSMSRPTEGRATSSATGLSGREEMAFSSAALRFSLGSTVPSSADEDADDPNVKNQADEPDGREVARSQDQTAGVDANAARIRSRLARRLLKLSRALQQEMGTVAAAVQMELLKRELSRCYEQLRGQSEQGFLSLVALYEGALAQRKWNTIDDRLLTIVGSALEVAYRKKRFPFAVVDEAREKLAEAMIPTGPMIDLEALDWDDLADDEEGEDFP